MLKDTLVINKKMLCDDDDFNHDFDDYLNH